MDTGVPGYGLGGGLATIMAAAATGSTLTAQEAVLRGSMASQSLAADLPNQVFQVMEGVQEANNNEVMNGNGASCSIGNTMETLAVQTLLAAMLAMLRFIMNAAEGGCQESQNNEEKTA